jgi:hypothetical protein
MSYRFTAVLEIIGINPYVSLPEEVLHCVLEDAQKRKGPIPVLGEINGNLFRQTLVRYAGAWRLYINTQMLARSPQRIGEIVNLEIAYDSSDRTVPMHAGLAEALEKAPDAKAAFEQLPPSLQKEINRSLAQLKTEESVRKNIERAIDFLRGKGRFIGRELRK